MDFEQQIDIDASRPGSQFRDEFKYDAQFNPNTRSISIVSKDPEVLQRHRLFMEEHFRIHDQGWEPATIINMHPRPLEHDFGYMGSLRVPERKKGQLYFRYLLKDYRTDSRDLGGAKYTPVSFMPLQLAKDFCRQFTEMGGVFCYIGDRPPKKEELDAAFEGLVKWYRRIFRAAQDQWSRKPQRAMIDDHMRSAAKTLLELEEIDKLPEWVDETRKEARVNKQTCLQCGADAKAAAKICVVCQYIFDEKFYMDRGFTVAGGIIIARPGQAVALAMGKSTVLNEPDLQQECKIDDVDFKMDKIDAEQSDEPLKKKGK